MNNWREYLEKIKGRKEQWLILFLVGLLLLVIAIPVSDQKETVKTVESGQVTSNGNDSDYISGMERKLEQVLEKVQGVGTVSVMITISESSEKVVEKDEETQMTSEEGTEGSTSSTERIETSIYSEDGGAEAPYVKKEISPRIEGVLVVAEGGDNAVVIESITSAVQALFGIESHKIKVMKHQ